MAHTHINVRTDDVKESKATDGIRASVASLCDLAGKLCSRLNDLSDRALGSAPQGGGGSGTSGPKPVPSGALNEITLGLETLGSLIDACHAAANRLDRIA